MIFKVLFLFLFVFFNFSVSTDVIQQLITSSGTTTIQVPAQEEASFVQGDSFIWISGRKQQDTTAILKVYSCDNQITYRGVTGFWNYFINPDKYHSPANFTIEYDLTFVNQKRGIDSANSPSESYIQVSYLKLSEISDIDGLIDSHPLQNTLSKIQASPSNLITFDVPQDVEVFWEENYLYSSSYGWICQFGTCQPDHSPCIDSDARDHFVIISNYGNTTQTVNISVVESDHPIQVLYLNKMNPKVTIQNPTEDVIIEIEDFEDLNMLSINWTSTLRGEDGPGTLRYCRDGYSNIVDSYSADTFILDECHLSFRPRKRDVDSNDNTKRNEKRYFDYYEFGPVEKFYYEVSSGSVTELTATIVPRDPLPYQISLNQEVAVERTKLQEAEFFIDLSSSDLNMVTFTGEWGSDFEIYANTFQDEDVCLADFRDSCEIKSQNPLKRGIDTGSCSVYLDLGCIYFGGYNISDFHFTVHYTGGSDFTMEVESIQPTDLTQTGFAENFEVEDDEFSFFSYDVSPNEIVLFKSEATASRFDFTLTESGSECKGEIDDCRSNSCEYYGRSCNGRLYFKAEASSGSLVANISVETVGVVELPINQDIDFVSTNDNSISRLSEVDHKLNNPFEPFTVQFTFDNIISWLEDDVQPPHIEITFLKDSCHPNQEFIKAGNGGCTLNPQSNITTCSASVNQETVHKLGNGTFHISANWRYEDQNGTLTINTGENLCQPIPDEIKTFCGLSGEINAIMPLNVDLIYYEAQLAYQDLDFNESNPQCVGVDKESICSYSLQPCDKPFYGDEPLCRDNCDRYDECTDSNDRKRGGPKGSGFFCDVGGDHPSDLQLEETSCKINPDCNELFGTKPEVVEIEVGILQRPYGYLDCFEYLFIFEFQVSYYDFTLDFRPTKDNQYTLVVIVSKEVAMQREFSREKLDEVINHRLVRYDCGLIIQPIPEPTTMMTTTDPTTMDTKPSNSNDPTKTSNTNNPTEPNDTNNPTEPTKTDPTKPNDTNNPTQSSDTKDTISGQETEATKSKTAFGESDSNKLISSTFVIFLIFYLIF